jgi:hypothetical protein
LAAVPEVAAQFKNGEGPLMIAYCDTPRMFEVLYPLITMMAPAMMPQMVGEGAGIDLSALPSTISVGRHLRPCLMTLRRTSDGLETYTRATVPGVGLLGPACVAILHEDWAGLYSTQGGAAAPMVPGPLGVAGGQIIGPIPGAPPAPK